LNFLGLKGSLFISISNRMDLKSSRCYVDVAIFVENNNEAKAHSSK